MAENWELFIAGFEYTDGKTTGKRGYRNTQSYVCKLTRDEKNIVAIKNSNKAKKLMKGPFLREQSVVGDLRINKYVN